MFDYICSLGLIGLEFLADVNRMVGSVNWSSVGQQDVRITMNRISLFSNVLVNDGIEL